MRIEENVPLKAYTTFRLGGPARYFVTCIDEQDIKDALVFAQEKQLPIFVLGDGSNTVCNDEGFSGLVLHMAIQGVQVLEENEDEVLLLVQGGEEWDEFVRYSVSQGWYGLENLSYIPGTVGAAPVQNIGAYGVDISTFVESVRVIDMRTGLKHTFENSDCHFAYRSSIFKEEKDRYIILSVMFRLSKEWKPILTYADLAKRFGGKEVSPEELREGVIDIRTRKLPDYRELPTAGSFFKNPELEKEEVDALLAKFPNVPVYPHEERFKVSAGYLIEHVAHMKGERRGDVGVYDKHALVLVNYGDGTFEELVILMKEIQDKVKKETGIMLKPEVNIVG